MTVDLVSGGCGFVGKNMVRRLYNTSDHIILFIDNLSVGNHPNEWLELNKTNNIANAEIFGEDERLYFIKEDFRDTLEKLRRNPNYFQDTYNIHFDKFNDVFHFAAIVGGRAMIDGDPMQVALDLAIDAEFFNWATKHKPKRILYPSSSAAYPIDLQTESFSVALKESDIDFKNMGQPDMTYGWTKLTGEYLAHIAATYYDLSVTCIRPFSGYGEDQDLTYPIPAIALRVAKKENPVEVWGTGNQGRDFVHIDDVLDCSLLAMEHITDGTAINIGRGVLTSFNEIITELTSIAGYNAEIKRLLDKPVGVHSRYCNMDFVKEKLGWEAKISLRDGMTRMYQAACERL